MLTLRTLTAAALCLPILSAGGLAQDWPAEPITMIIPYAAGGGTDILGRGMAEEMSKELGQTIVVVNQDGGSNTVGMAAVAEAEPNGYTIAFTPLTPITQAPYAMKGLPYTFESFEYACWIYDTIFAVVVKGDSPYRTFDDLKKAASSGSAPLSYGFAGLGSVPHAQMADAAGALGMNLTAVPFRGAAPATAALMSGEIAFGNLSIGSVANQDLRVLAVFSSERLPFYPDVPTAEEVGIPNPVPPANVGILVRAGTPEPIRARIEAACETAVKSELMQRLGVSSQTALFFKDGAEFREAAGKAYTQMGAILTKLGLVAK